MPAPRLQPFVYLRSHETNIRHTFAREEERLAEEARKRKQDNECVCGNWRTILNECESLIGKTFRDADGTEYNFFGLVHGNDDYYYGMVGKAGLRLLSCVGSMQTHGFELKEKPE